MVRASSTLLFCLCLPAGMENHRFCCSLLYLNHNPVTLSSIWFFIFGWSPCFANYSTLQWMPTSPKWKSASKYFDTPLMPLITSRGIFSRISSSNPFRCSRNNYKIFQIHGSVSSACYQYANLAFQRRLPGPHINSYFWRWTKYHRRTSIHASEHFKLRE